MRIRVTIDPRVLQYTRDSVRSDLDRECEVKEGTTAGELVARFSFSEGAEVIAVVNGVCYLDKDRPIREGDSVVLLPLITGG